MPAIINITRKMIKNQKKVPKATATASSFVLSFLVVISLRAFGLGVVAASNNATTRPAAIGGTQYSSSKWGPIGDIQMSAAMTANKMIIKNAQKLPHGPLTFNKNLKKRVIKKAIISR